MNENNEQKLQIPGAGGMIISKAVLEGRHRAQWLYRQGAPYGNGWVCFGEGEDEAFANDPANMTVADYNRLIELEPAAYLVFHMPVGTELELREFPEGRFFVDYRTGEPVRERVPHPMEQAFARNRRFLNQPSYSAEFFAGLFTESETLQVARLGEADFPTGLVVLADPLAYLGSKYETVLERRIAPGSYPVEVAVLHSPMAGLRYAAARLVLSDKPVAKWELAMPSDNRPEDLGKPGVFSFFGVDAGLACITDAQVAFDYAGFERQWTAKNPEKNIYDDYFEALFGESYQKWPEIQREGGDFLVWRLPESGRRLIMLASGLGDGIYSGYWGLDKQGEPAQLVVPFMNPEFFV